MFSCEYCGIFKIVYFEERSCFYQLLFQYNQSIAIWLFKKFLFQNKNIKRIVNVKFNNSIYIYIYIYIYIHIYKVYVMFYYKIPWFYQQLNIYSVHAARLLDLSRVIMLSPLKWGKTPQMRKNTFKIVRIFPSYRNRYNISIINL